MQNKLNILAIDDEIHSLELLELMLGSITDYDISFKPALGSQMGRQAILDCNPDLVILDNEMPGMYGLELLNSIAPYNFSVLFLSAHSAYAVDACSQNTIGYLLKPLKMDELKKALDRFVENLNKVKSIHPIQSYNKIKLPTLQGILNICLNEICFFETSFNIVKAVMTSGDKIYIEMTLDKLEEKLKDLGFFRVHRQFLVHLCKIEKFMDSKNATIVMENKEIIPISRRKKTALKYAMVL